MAQSYIGAPIARKEDVRFLTGKARYVDDVIAFVADIRGEKQPDRTLEHERVVQETILRASQ